ncbi:response regulator [Marinicella sediminis]|uniref:Response regulator n=1 Tax=Marinicella sediminis TaxID=1792834 RepID=A0ABV7J6J9_9GAMM|nr:response regulator transcription factor [Marinicella sediminis]
MRDKAPLADKIIIADDHPMFRNALRQSLGLDLNNCVIIEVESSDSLKTQLRSHHDADMLLLDLNMPGVEGFSALAFTQKKYPDLPIIMISANDKPDTIMHAKHFGALGFISKSASVDDIRKAIRTVLEGNTYFPYQFNEALFMEHSQELADITAQVASLTPQQHKVLCLIKQGLLNKQIAYDLNISEATVKAHVTAIMRKLNVNNRTQAVMKVSAIDLPQN